MVNINKFFILFCGNFYLGNGEVGSKMRSGPTLSLKALKRKFSLPEKEQDYQPVRREVGLRVEITWLIM